MSFQYLLVQLKKTKNSKADNNQLLLNVIQTISSPHLLNSIQSLIPTISNEINQVLVIRIIECFFFFFVNSISNDYFKYLKNHDDGKKRAVNSSSEYPVSYID